MGKLILEEDLVPDVILSSPAVRARKTAEVVADVSGFSGEFQLVEDLYHGWPSDYLEAMQSVSDHNQRVMVVGHNPGLELLLELLTDHAEKFPTAALAVVRVPIDSWGDLNDETEGILEQYWLPRHLS
jgi:phosphohistidine phosphatase